MSYIYHFDHPQAADATVAGGKGANLARLTMAGFPVPTGFTIGAAAYHAFIADLIDQLPNADDDAALARRGEAARQLLGERAFPPQVERELRAALGRFPADWAWSVRSSATCEDGASAAFAGQHDTFLNVRGVEAVLVAVKACWISLWGERAVLYRRHQGFADQDAAMAVVVQQLVPCAVAGVAFSVNPVSGRMDELVIDGNLGLGESVVSGEAPVDHWVLDRATLAVREARIAEKSIAVTPLEQGTQELALDGEAALAPCLSAEQLTGLGALVRRVAEHYGWPQDVEWGWHAGQFYLLQSRPITRIPPRWTRDESAERFPNPITPLVWEFLSEAFDAALPEALARMDMPAVGTWFAMFDSHIYGNQNAVELVGGFRPFAARDMPELLAELPSISTRYQWLLDLPAEWQRDLDRFLLAIGRMSSRQLYTLNVAELWTHLGELNQVGCDYFRPNITISMAHSILYRVLHLVVLMRGPDGARALVDALCAAPETRTALVNRELGELAQLAASEPALRDELLAGEGQAMLADGRIAAHPAFAARLGRFLEDYGHREVDIDYYQPTWSGQRMVVLDQLASMLRADNLPAHGERERAQRLRQFEAEQALLANAPRELGFFLHELIRLARVYAGLDDLEHFETTRLNAEGHRTATELGRRLYAAGLVERPDDVFFFTRADLDQLVAAFPHTPENDYRERVAAARERYQQALMRSPAWELEESVVSSPWSDVAAGTQQTTDNGPLTTDNNVLHGIAGSPGVVTGQVFQVRGPDDFGRFPAGAILVARTTNPAWTPLFYSAAGVVVESGGPLSHGAVTARELGLPAVMAVRGALAALHDGQPVRVDGARGEVELLRS